jgi:hypothetical protein
MRGVAREGGDSPYAECGESDAHGDVFFVFLCARIELFAECGHINAECAERLTERRGRHRLRRRYRQLNPRLNRAGHLHSSSEEAGSSVEVSAEGSDGFIEYDSDDCLQNT